MGGGGTHIIAEIIRNNATMPTAITRGCFVSLRCGAGGGV